MNVISLSLSLILFATFVASDDHGEHVLNLDKASFETSVEASRLFVMFYAPWCGHCKRLAPTWDDLAKEYNVEDTEVIIAKVDCTVESALCVDHGVRGYPTVKFFNRNKEGVKFTSQRTIEELKKFMQEQMGKEEPKKEEDTKDKEPVEAAKPNAEGVYDLTDANFDDHIKTGHTFVKFFAPWCGHCKRLAPTWDDLAKAYAGNDKVTIAKVDCTVQRESCGKFSIRGYPTLNWFTDGQKSEDYRGGRSLDDLKAFVVKMTGVAAEGKKSVDGKIPEDMESVAVELTDEDFEESVADDLTLVSFASTNAKQMGMIDMLGKLAKKYRDSPKIMFSYVDCSKNPKTCGAQEVKEGPVLKLFRSGKFVEDFKDVISEYSVDIYVQELLGKKKDEL